MKKINMIYLALFALFLIPVFQADSAEIKETRYYSESGKTRIVFQLDEVAQYKSYYDPKHNICIVISDTKLSEPSQTFSVGNKLINVLSLKQTDDNTVDVKILLAKSAKYKIFDVESPNRIVVDITPFEDVITPKVTAISADEVKTKSDATNENKQVNNSIINKTDSPNIAKEKLIEDNIEALPAEPTELSIMDFGWQSLEFLDGNILTILQYAFNVLILAVLVFIGFKIKTMERLARYIKKNRRTLKDNPVFADMLMEIEKGRRQNSEKMVKKKPVEIKKSKNDIREDEKGVSDENTAKQYDRVQELAKRGVDPITISQKSNIPVGEVNLILDLIRTRKDG